MGVYVIEPVHLLESTPPKVSSPFPLERDVIGLKEIPTRFCPESINCR